MESIEALPAPVVEHGDFERGYEEATLVRPGAGGPGGTAHGAWTLHATLLVQPLPRLVLPRPVRFDGNTYRMTSAVTDGLAVLDVQVSGPAAARAQALTAAPPAELAGQPVDPRSAALAQVEQRYLDLRIIGPDGRDVLVHVSDVRLSGSGPVHCEVTFDTPLPGTYRVRVGEVVELPLVVPASAIS